LVGTAIGVVQIRGECVKPLILSLALLVTCCGCSGGFKSAQSTTQSPVDTQTPPTALSVSTTSLPNAVKEIEYSATLTAQGGTPPYAWKAVSGQLPAGLTLSSAGVLSGKPSSTGEFDITVQVTDSAASPATARASTHAKKR